VRRLCERRLERRKACSRTQRRQGWEGEQELACRFGKESKAITDWRYSDSVGPVSSPTREYPFASKRDRRPIVPRDAELPSASARSGSRAVDSRRAVRRPLWCQLALGASSPTDYYCRSSIAMSFDARAFVAPQCRLGLLQWNIGLAASCWVTLSGSDLKAARNMFNPPTFCCGRALHLCCRDRREPGAPDSEPTPRCQVPTTRPCSQTAGAASEIGQLVPCAISSIDSERLAG
jgi:hypothetical protein